MMRLWSYQVVGHHVRVGVCLVAAQEADWAHYGHACRIASSHAQCQQQNREEGTRLTIDICLITLVKYHCSHSMDVLYIVLKTIHLYKCRQI